LDYRRQKEEPTSLSKGLQWERSKPSKFLSVRITEDLTWSHHIVVKEAQERLFNLSRLKTFAMAPKTLTNFYRCTVESILSGCITAWYGNCIALDRQPNVTPASPSIASPT
jgi:hypothetical protein